jgi:hypothetical protein
VYPANDPLYVVDPKPVALQSHGTLHSICNQLYIVRHSDPVIKLIVLLCTTVPIGAQVVDLIIEHGSSSILCF